MKKILFSLLGLSLATATLADNATTFIVNASNKDMTIKYSICKLDQTQPGGTCSAAISIGLPSNAHGKHYTAVAIQANEYLNMLSAASSDSKAMTFPAYSCISETYILGADLNLGSIILQDYNVPNKIFCKWNVS